MYNFTLRQLAIFEATARLGTLTAAANEQAISQSAASQAIKELESALKMPLFYRSGRELVLTQHGEVKLPKVKQLLNYAGNLKACNENEVTGTLHLAVSATIGCYLVPRVLPLFLAQYPNIIPDIQITNSEQVIEALEKGKAQIGAIESPVSLRNFELAEIADDHLELFCSPEHPLAQSGIITLEQFEQQLWILREPSASSRYILEHALNEAGIVIKQVMSFNQQEAIKQYVMAGMGIGCLSGYAILEAVKSGYLVQLKSPLELKRQLKLVMPPVEYRSSVINAFISFLLSNKGLGVKKLTKEYQESPPRA